MPGPAPARARARLPLAPERSDDLRLDLARSLLRLLGAGSIARGQRADELCIVVGIEVADLDRARTSEAKSARR